MNFFYNSLLQVIREGVEGEEHERDIYQGCSEDLDGSKSSEEESCIGDSNEEEGEVSRVPTQEQFLDYVNDLESRNTELRDLVDKRQCRMRRDQSKM
jgi:hypothetical protein